MTDQQTTFFLANRTVSGRSVRHLLLSSSFGVNALLYAIWLGYSLGVYAIIIQIAWSLGILLLHPFLNLPECKKGTSLPGILGEKFGRPMQIYSAAVTALGLLMLLGWEFAICSRTIFAQTTLSQNTDATQGTLYSQLFLVVTIACAVYYTSKSGMSANAKAAQILNAIKIAFLGLVTLLSVFSLIQLPYDIRNAALFPPLSHIAANFGVMAVITNLVFNLLWQVVDASSWQSVLAAEPAARKDQFRLLSSAGFYVFVCVGLFGSVIGMSLAGSTGVDPDNVLITAVTRYGALNPVLLIGLLLTIACCLVTFTDGVLLTITQVTSYDFPTPSRFFAHSIRMRAFVMGTTAIVAWLVVKAVESSPFGLFNFVYALIVPQLSLVGAIVALRFNQSQAASTFLPASSLFALVAGLSFVVIGFVNEVKWAMEFGGSVAIAVSLSPLLFYHLRKHCHD